MTEQAQKNMYHKVLVIDDNEVDRYIATRNIKTYHFADEIVAKDSAMSGLEYLESLKDTPEELPQVIFLDIRMPEIDGFGFLKEYEKLPISIQNKSIIMILSTSLDPSDHERARNNPLIKKFLNKPLDKSSLSDFKPAE